MSYLVLFRCYSKMSLREESPCYEVYERVDPLKLIYAFAGKRVEMEKVRVGNWKFIKAGKFKLYVINERISPVFY